jgi:hypothetical protein
MGQSPELLTAIQTLRLKLKAAKGMIRDLTVCAADVERLLHQNAEPKEAERDEHERERDRGVAA